MTGMTFLITHQGELTVITAGKSEKREQKEAGEIKMKLDLNKNNKILSTKCTFYIQK